MKKYQKIAVQLVFVLTFLGCSSAPDYKISTDGPEKVEFKVLPFGFDDVKLLDGPYKHATELNVQSLLNYEPDKLLAKFLSEAGLETKAEHYGGWESNTIAGHSLGHYLSAICMMYKTTGNEEFLNRAQYIVDELDRAQKADGEGYIGAFPDGKRILEEEVAKGEIRSQGFDLNGIWVPYYTEHKVMAGLFDAYELCGIEKALELNVRFADWLEGVIENLNDSLVQVMLHCEHGGINESLAELYAITGKQKYLDMSYVFHHKVILDSLAAGIDILPGKHGNTQVPKLVGLARRYELTGDTEDKAAAEFFWDRVVHHHSYVTGGHGNHEYFGEPDKLSNRLSEGTTETCNVYNMLKLSRHLFEWSASAEVADYYERALINQILSSQNPDDGRVIYNLSLEMGGFKVYQNPLWFTCCVGTGMENHSKYARNIYYHNNEELFVSQYIASELSWKEKGFNLTQKTQYPEEHGTTLSVTCEEPVKVDLMIRYPYWAENGIDIRVNGNAVKVKEEPGSFVRISRKWNDGDEVKVEIPFSLRLEEMPDNADRVAVMYGPLVMAGDLGEIWNQDVNDPMFVPIFMTENRNPEDWFEAVEGKTNTFKSVNLGKPHDVEIIPFYKMHNKRYTVYWDIFTEEGWDKKQAEYKANLERKKQIEEMTIDLCQMGEMQPERDHNFQGERTNPGEFKGRKMRESRSGWFSVDMGVYLGQPMGLVVEYWGGFPGSKTFDILVNDEVIATENISNIKDGEFVFREYVIPDELTVDKGKVTVTFKAHKGNMAGPVFTVRTIKR